MKPARCSRSAAGWGSAGSSFRWVGRWFDGVASGVSDVLLAFPPLIFLLGVVTAHYGVEGDGFYGIPLSRDSIADPDFADLGPKAWPRFVRIAHALPSTATNKVLKRELRAQALDTDDLLWSRGERNHDYTDLVRSNA